MLCCRRGCNNTHGFIKKTDETPKEEVNHFKNLRADYYTWLLGDG
jgi:phage-related protein